MSTTPDFDQLARTWMQDGPTEMPDRALTAALDEVHVTSQRRFGAAWRTLLMNSNLGRIAAAAVVAIILIGVGAILMGRSSPPEVGGTGSTHSPGAATATAAAPSSPPSTASPVAPTTSPRSTPAPVTCSASPCSVVFKAQFDPSTLIVKVGTEVTWFNPSSFSMHLVFQGGGFESPASQGQPYKHTFDAPGTYPYLNTYDGTAGTIIVTN